MASGSMDLGATTGGVPPSGAAGGDLSGTYPNPSVASVGGSSAANIHTSQLLTAAAVSTATATTLCLRDANGNANFSALNMVHTGGGNNNIGIGGAASAGEAVVVYTMRNQANDTVWQIDNSSADPVATAGIQAIINGGSQGFVFKAHNSGSALAIFSNRCGPYQFGGDGLTLSGGGAGDVIIAAAGYATSNIVARFNADRSITAYGGVIVNAAGVSRPTAGVAYRGMLYILQGAGGVTDKIQVCLKSAADTYSWVDIVNGG